MRELWLRFDDINDYNNKYSLIGQFLGEFPGNDVGYAMLSSTKQRVSFFMSVTRQAKERAISLFGEGNVAVRPDFEPEFPMNPPEPIPKAEVPKEETVEELDEQLIETIEAACEESNKECDETPVETTTIEGINMPVEIEDEVSDDTEEEAEEKEEKTEEEKPITWTTPSEDGLTVFNNQWKEIMKNTEKKAKEERKKNKSPNTELVMAQVKAMASIMEKAIVAWASDKSFEDQLKLPWKSAERMINYVREQAKALAVNGVTVLSGYAETEEELKKMAPFSFIYDYYMADDKAEVEKEIKEKEKAKEAEEKKKAERERGSLITKAKRNSDRILEIAKAKARTKLELSEEFKALSKQKQGKEVSKAAVDFMDEARAEYTAKEEKRNVHDNLLEQVKKDLADTVKKMKAAERDATYEAEVTKRYEALSKEEKHPGIPEWTPEQFPEEYAKEQEEKSKPKKVSKDTTPTKVDNPAEEVSEEPEQNNEISGQMSIFDMIG